MSKVTRTFRIPCCKVFNHAVGGRSTKSFIDEGRWAAIMEKLGKGDIVIIQFGHNDEKPYDPKRYTEPFGSYYDNLCRFVADVRSKGAFPVLLTPVTRRHFMADGTLKRSHGLYPEAMKKAAKDTKTPLVDIEQMTYDWILSLGDERSREYFMWVGEKKDNTHLQESGALKVAGMVADALKGL